MKRTNRLADERLKIYTDSGTTTSKIVNISKMDLPSKVVHIVTVKLITIMGGVGTPF